MKKLDKITLSNFQNHTDTTVTLCPGVNYIMGPSDNGKSVIIRAVEWVMKNRPSGDSLMQRGAVSVKVGIQSGRTRILREKTKKVNQYKHNRESFKAIATKVPDEIKAVLDMNDVNIQGQFDQFFLLQDTPGQVAHKFNNIMGLDIIDIATKKINVVVNKAKAEATNAQAEVAEKMEALEDFIYLDSIERLIGKAENLDNKKAIIDDSITKVEHHISQYELSKKKVEGVGDIIQAEPLVKTALELQKKSIKIYTDMGRLSRQIDTFTENEQLIKENEDWLCIETEVIAIQNKMNKGLKIRASELSLQKCISTNENIESLIQSILKRVIKAEKDMDDFRKENKACPFCDKEW